MQGITKRVAFLVDLKTRGGYASARSVGEAVEERHGAGFATESAERNAIMNALINDHLVRFRRPKSGERVTKQQRYAFALTKRGQAEVEEIIRQAHALTRVA